MKWKLSCATPGLPSLNGSSTWLWYYQWAWSQEEKDHSWWAKTRHILEASFLPLVWIVEVVLAWSCCSGNWLYSFISSLAWKSMWSVLQFTSKDWMDGSVDGRNILAAAVKGIFHSGQIIRSALCEGLGCKKTQQILQKSNLFGWG